MGAQLSTSCSTGFTMLLPLMGILLYPHRDPIRFSLSTVNKSVTGNFQARLENLVLLVTRITEFYQVSKQQCWQCVVWCECSLMHTVPQVYVGLHQVGSLNACPLRGYGVWLLCVLSDNCWMCSRI